MEFMSIIQQKGISLSGINPGSNGFALTVEDSLYIVELLKGSHYAILGGDILSEKSGKLIYAFQFWGREYHYLNWYCNKQSNETNMDYVQRSHQKAKEGINDANTVSFALDKKCYIVLVIKKLL
jgi:hypothetical protein